MKDHKCGSSCLLGLVLGAVGILFLVGGFVVHTDGSNLWNWTALLYYFVGLGLFAHGKHCSNGSCEMGSSKKKK